ncbi:hypothetical protein DV515_00005963 [Chloebia gouldiae]|uniref:Uncharacterized protein n=1 Tax=Chloebia gouldiae TaxID=44316 RepID=A0A3L8SLA0_CHLGU|nr:hypothetical protein DV515_00005963 [Chloebia gouldiae]
MSDHRSEYIPRGSCLNGKEEATAFSDTWIQTTGLSLFQPHLLCPHASSPGKSQIWELWAPISVPGQASIVEGMCTSRVEISSCWCL